MLVACELPSGAGGGIIIAPTTGISLSIHWRMAWHVYLLQCDNGDFYTGLTTNIDRRFMEHQSGIGGKFTKAARPVKLVYHETFDLQASARRREIQLKNWSKAKKLALVAGDLQALKHS